MFISLNGHIHTDYFLLKYRVSIFLAIYFFLLLQPVLPMIHFQLGDGCISSFWGEDTTGIPCICPDYDLDLSDALATADTSDSSSIPLTPEAEKGEESTQLLDLESSGIFLPLTDSFSILSQQQSAAHYTAFIVSIPDPAPASGVIPPIYT